MKRFLTSSRIAPCAAPSALLTCLCALLAGCATANPDAGLQAAAPTVRQSAPASDAAGAATGFAFAGTTWQLVKIQSMDDSVFTPRDRSHYTLTFAADGKMLLRADCNRGGGTWSSPGPSQLQFGPIATTRMKCAEGSLSERYLAQFEWIRSYVMRDGHLFLATMADGAIIEFEPLLTD